MNKHLHSGEIIELIQSHWPFSISYNELLLNRANSWLRAKKWCRDEYGYNGIVSEYSLTDNNSSLYQNSIQFTVNNYVEFFYLNPTARWASWSRYFYFKDIEQLIMFKLMFG